MQINQPAPDFELRELTGGIHRLSHYRGVIVIVNFWSADCPHSERADHHLMEVVEKRNGGMILLSIAANRNESIQVLEDAARARRLPVVLIDVNQTVADLYGAQTTPHVFVIDQKGTLRYRGAVDDVTFRQRKATRYFLEEAIDALLDGRFPEMAETPAYGCTIVREI